MTFSPGAGVCDSLPSALKLPSAAIFVATLHVAAGALGAHRRLDLQPALGQRAQPDDGVAGPEEVLRRRDERAAAEVAGRARGRLGDRGGRSADEGDENRTQNTSDAHAGQPIR